MTRLQVKTLIVEELIVEELAAEDSVRIELLMVGYLKDMAQFTAVPKDKAGQFTYPYLRHYWQEPDRFPFIFQIEGEDCGFALVRRLLNPENGTLYHSMAEFYISPEFRRRGLGQVAAKSVIKRFCGVWEIIVLKTNLPAQPFWKKLLSELSPTLSGEETETHYRYDLRS